MSQQASRSHDLRVLAARAQVALNRKTGIESPANLVGLSQEPLTGADDPEQPSLRLMDGGTVTDGGDDDGLGGRALAYRPGQPMRGPDVLELQLDLQRLGHYHGTPDGSFGRATDLAVRDFQATYDATVDGVAGDISKGVLRYLRRNHVDAGRKATAEQLHIIAHVAKILSTTPIVIDLVTGLQRITDPVARQVAERLTSRLGVLVGQEIKTRTGLQCLLLDSSAYASDEDSLARFVNEVQRPLLISLSLLDDPNQPAGTATLYFGDHDKFHSHVGLAIARLIHEEVIRQTDAPDRGVQPENSALFTKAKLPTVRVVIGNLAAPEDRRRSLRGDRLLARYAVGVANGVSRHFAFGDELSVSHELRVEGRTRPPRRGTSEPS